MVCRIRRMQRLDPEMKARWYEYCDAHCEGRWYDPGKHDAAFLAGFIAVHADSILASAEPGSHDEGDEGDGDAAAEAHALDGGVDLDDLDDPLDWLRPEPGEAGALGAAPDPPGPLTPGRPPSASPGLSLPSAPGLGPGGPSRPRAPDGSKWIQVGNVTYYVGDPQGPPGGRFTGLDRDAYGRWVPKAAASKLRAEPAPRTQRADGAPAEPPPKRPKTDGAPSGDRDYELDFLFFLEEHLKDNPVPMSVHSVRREVLPLWSIERPWLEDEKKAEVTITQAFLEANSDRLVWIPGPGNDEVNRADFVGWDPENSAMAQRIVGELDADGSGTQNRRIAGEISSFSMQTAVGYITCREDYPGVGRQIQFFQDALPGILANCQLGGSHAMRNTTWFKGREVGFVVDFGCGKPRAKDIKFLS
mmetsp:Transcript_66380/g.176508  ORF Transcript_66380/g.176508 Transcript_66380/m.176508 type:complete len:417 (+) Transcript_66380:3-1253(+)